MLETVKKPLIMRKSGVCALFYYAMRGTSSSFHSRAEQILRLLMDTSIVGIGDEFTQGKQSLKNASMVFFLIIYLLFTVRYHLGVMLHNYNKFKYVLQLQKFKIYYLKI